MSFLTILTVRHEPFPSISISTSSVSPTFFGLVGFFGLNISLKVALKTQFLVKTVFLVFEEVIPFDKMRWKKFRFNWFSVNRLFTWEYLSKSRREEISKVEDFLVQMGDLWENVRFLFSTAAVGSSIAGQATGMTHTQMTSLVPYKGMW